MPAWRIHRRRRGPTWRGAASVVAPGTAIGCAHVPRPGRAIGEPVAQTALTSPARGSVLTRQ